MKKKTMTVRDLRKMLVGEPPGREIIVLIGGDVVRSLPLIEVGVLEHRDSRKRQLTLCTTKW